MNPRDIEKLLGGYATGTLSEQEREALFAAALGNQELFDALADEEGLREMLSDPATRERLLSALEMHEGVPALTLARAAAALPALASAPAPAVPGFWQRLSGWMFQPAPIAVMAALVVIVTAVVVRQNKPAPEQQVAMTQRAEPAPEQDRAHAVTPAPAPVPVPQPKAAKPAAKDVAPTNAISVTGPAPPPPPPAMAPVAVNQAVPAPLAPEAVRVDETAAAGQQGAQAPMMAARKAAAPAPPARAFTYRLQRSNAAGSYAEVPMPAELRAGDQVRLVVTPARAGSLLVVFDGQPLYSAMVTAGTEYVIPQRGGLTSTAGDKVLAISFSATSPIAGFRSAAPAAAPNGSAGETVHLIFK